MFYFVMWLMGGAAYTSMVQLARGAEIGTHLWLDSGFGLLCSLVVLLYSLADKRFSKFC